MNTLSGGSTTGITACLVVRTEQDLPPSSKQQAANTKQMRNPWHGFGTDLVRISLHVPALFCA